MAGEARSSQTMSYRETLRSLCTQHSGSKQNPHQFSRAVVGLNDGSQVPCVVEELNEHGAYLTLSGRPSHQCPLHVGDHVAVHIFQAGGVVDSMIVDATVTRIANDAGLGMAVRFCAAEQDEHNPHNDLSSDDWMTEVPEIARRGANVQLKKISHKRDAPKLKTPARVAGLRTSLAGTVNLGRLVRPTLWAGLISSVLALFILFGDWLQAVL